MHHQFSDTQFTYQQFHNITSNNKLGFKDQITDEPQTRICGLNKNIPVNVIHALPAINRVSSDTFNKQLVQACMFLGKYNIMVFLIGIYEIAPNN